MTSHLRILQLHNRYREAGGEDTVVRVEGELLRARGHEVHLHEVTNPEGALASAKLALQAANNRGSARRVTAAIQAFRPDVVHLHNWWFTLSPSVVDAVRTCGVPLVATAHNHRLGCADATFFRQGRICTRCLGGPVWRAAPLACHRESRLASAAIATTIEVQRRRNTWDGVDRWMPLSAFQAELLVASGLDPRRLAVKPNFTPDPGPRTDPPSSSRRVVVLGRLVAEKGVDVLLDAWRLAAPDFDLVVVGDGELRARLEAAAPARVSFLGHQPADEVRRLLLTSRALLFPVQWLEPFGLVMVEAMAAGMPVLASDLGAVTEVVGDAAGWCTADPSANGWAALLAALDDDAEVDRRGAAARARWAEHFAPAPVLDALEGVYRRVVDEGRSEDASRRT